MSLQTRLNIPIPDIKSVSRASVPAGSFCLSIKADQVLEQIRRLVAACR
jgi:hypothetical protein